MAGLFIGLMSGTSVDSIDSALVNFDNDGVELLEWNSSPIEKKLKVRIFNFINERSPKIH